MTMQAVHSHSHNLREKPVSNLCHRELPARQNTDHYTGKHFFSHSKLNKQQQNRPHKFRPSFDMTQHGQLSFSCCVSYKKTLQKHTQFQNQLNIIVLIKTIIQKYPSLQLVAGKGGCRGLPPSQV